MRSLRRLAAAVAVLAVAGAVAWCGGIGPRGPVPGGVLRGESAEPPADWSFSDAVAEVQVETRWLGLPYSVTTWCLSHAGRLYVPSGDCSRRWTRLVSERPEVRVRIDGKVYALRARRETDPALAEALAPVVLAKYFGIAVEAARWRPERNTGCIFAMEPR